MVLKLEFWEIIYYVYFVGMFNFREILMIVSVNIKIFSMDFFVKLGKKLRKYVK